MIKHLLIAACVFNISTHATSFSQSKKLLLKRVYFDNQRTFYCDNPYEIKQINGKEKALIIKDKTYYTPRRAFTKKGKPNIRSMRIEWEHIVPAHNFGKHLPCWKRGGRKACKKDSLFKRMEADMMNLVPAIGEINGDRSNYRFSANPPQAKQYGNCNFQVDFKRKRAYVKDEIKGDIARAYLYMEKKYGIKISSQEKRLFSHWNKIEPSL